MTENNDKYKMIVRTAKLEFEQKHERYRQITKERTTVVEKRTRKFVSIDIEATKKRLEERMSRFTVPVFNYVDKLQEPPVLIYIGVSYVDGAFRLLESQLPLNSTSRPNLKINISQMIITNHAIERWLERNESSDYKESLLQLGHALLAMNHQLISKQFSDKQEVYGRVERQVECLDGGIAIVIVDQPEDTVLKHFCEKDAVVVTYISSEMVNQWNEAKANEKFANVSEIDWSKKLPSEIALAMDKLSEISKADKNYKEL